MGAWEGGSMGGWKHGGRCMRVGAWEGGCMRVGGRVGVGA